MARVLLLFVDGIGLGADDAAINPFVTATLPVLSRLLGAPTIASAAPHHGAAASLVGVDARLGMEGTPQSGTGQASLLTGSNAAALHGSHFGPWVPSRLQSLVRDDSILVKARRAGFTVAFANAYPEEVKQLADGTAAIPSDAPGRTARVRRVPAFLRAGPPLAAIGAGLMTRHTPELERGDAVASELTNDGWRDRLGRANVPVITAADAGRNLARIAAQHDLTLFAHYTTDYVGHQQDLQQAVASLEALDAFIGGIIGNVDDDLMLVMVSDHGNIEDVRVGHTRNPAVGIVVGHGHAAVAARLLSLTDVTPAILDVLAS